MKSRLDVNNALSSTFEPNLLKVFPKISILGQIIAAKYRLQGRSVHNEKFSKQNNNPGIDLLHAYSATCCLLSHC